jgi:signal transduction histidine kinase
LTDFADHQLVEVKDDGIGMESEKYDSIFELQPGENQIGTTGEKGTGLGLTLCKEFVEMHGGKIGAKPNSDKGSIFWFVLPKQDSQNQ